MFMLEIMGGISSRALSQLGYELLVLEVPVDDTDWARRALDERPCRRFHPASHPACTPEQLEALSRRRRAARRLGRRRRRAATTASVSGDSFSGGRLATEHLSGAGRRRIAFIGGPTGSIEVMERRRGYEDGPRAAGVEVDAGAHRARGWMNAERNRRRRRSPSSSSESSGIDAVFACSDMSALGAIEAIRAQRSLRPGRHSGHRLRRHRRCRLRQSTTDHDPPGRPARRHAARPRARPAAPDRRDHERQPPGGARRAGFGVSFFIPGMQPVARR